MSEKQIGFAEAYELPIGKHVEKKGRFSYLSWAVAVKFLRENFPKATWTITHLDGRPYIATKKGCFVEVTVHLDGLDFMQVHPVLDHKNKTVHDPDAFQVNTSIQRCLAKAIGIATGIGLGLYLGEDLPIEPEEVKQKEIPVEKWMSGIESFFEKKQPVEKLEKWLLDKKPELELLNETDQNKIQVCINEVKEAISEQVNT